MRRESESKDDVDPALADALSEFVDLLNAGSAPDIEDFLELRKDMAVELRPLLELVEWISEYYRRRRTRQSGGGHGIPERRDSR